MKLNSKFTLYFALSKLLIFGLFLLILPWLFSFYARYSIDGVLKKQQHAVFDNIRHYGLQHYLQGDSSFGSYTMLKEDYIALQQVQADSSLPGSFSIANEARIIDRDTIEYRILHRYFEADGTTYLLEIGRSETSIRLYAALLQKVALGILGLLLITTVTIDYFYGTHILRPLRDIVRLRLQHQSFPFTAASQPISTSTLDFQLLDQRLRELMAQATAAYTREKEFTANASHELLTPIAVLRSKLENLLDTPSLSDAVIDKLQSSLHTLDRLQGLVRTLLFLARVDSGEYSRTETVHLHPLLQDIISELQLFMDAKSLSLNMTVDPQLRISHQHRQLLFQLLYNLIHNAIQYNVQGGRVDIRGSFSADKFKLCIQDTGIGMDATQTEKLFQRFHRLAVGNGLGLSIAKSIADFLAIDIQVHSEKQRGTTIYLLFEAQDCQAYEPQ
ncbi:MULTISPECIES: sensor histidine kinase [Sphingobacterium]|uniref:sensor histidine kinase n=1 Tax=Sphingobacterium TaxID=28453 RepID=UPI0013DCBB66|nr:MULTISPECIES: HAMP domain-containing sensor histidine kinase [unclassified Sphingobacterium]